MTGPILMIGCGKMGGALMAGWLARGIEAARIHVVDPAPRHALPAGVAHYHAADALPADFAPDLVMLAVKPQVMDEALPGCRRFADRAAYLSIAAGKTTAYFARHLGAEARVIRAMPNTPAAVGQGITACFATEAVPEAARRLAGELLSAVGEVVWVDDESLMDAVTGVSGSGPAYVFHFVECLAAAGERQGLPADLAMRLARATVAGAGALLGQSPESAGQLRENVTSPKGTTAEGLAALMGEDALARLVAEAVAAATARSRELAD